MYAALLDAGVGLIVQYGLVVLLVVFALEGALVGKLIPTRALFVAVALAVGSDAVGLLAVVVVAVLGATLGQLALFGVVRYGGVPAEVLPSAVEPDGDGRLAGWVDRWGLTAVAVTNLLPVTRGSLTVPVALTDADPLRFSASSLLGTSLYAGGLVAVAVGLDVAVGLL